MQDQPLSRVPFRAEEEAMISSMSLWMRFIAIYTVIVGFLLIFVVLFAMVFFSMVETSQDEVFSRLQGFLREAGGALMVLLAAALAAAAVIIWSEFALYQAGDNFGLVSRTDLADQDYLARGFEKLRIYYMIQVLTAVAFVLLALVVAFGVVLHGSAAVKPIVPEPHGTHGE